MDIAPYSGAIEAASNLVNSVVGRIWPDKTKVVEIQAEVQKAIIAGEYGNELAAITAVNATMQAEAKSEHWPQYSWRPTIGFTFAAILLNNYLLLPYLKSFGILPLEIPGTVWSAFLVILGAASAGRSWEKVSGKTNGNGG